MSEESLGLDEQIDHVVEWMVELMHEITKLAKIVAAKQEEDSDFDKRLSELGESIEKCNGAYARKIAFDNEVRKCLRRSYKSMFDRRFYIS